MDQLISMRVFRRVAELGSFSGAAQALQLSNGAVSKYVSALEGHLGVQLIHRTTRRLGLTDAGRAYLQRCVQILDDIEETELAVSGLHGAPRGVLRVNAPVTFSMLQLGSIFAEFLQTYRDIQLDLSLSDRFVDPVEEGFDVVLRIGTELPDSTLIARRLAPIEHVICAAPAYLKQAGVPKKPEDLRSHECLIYAQTSPSSELWFDGPGGARRIRVSGRYVCNNSIPLRDALLAGVGITLIPLAYVEELLKSGKLIAVLQRYRTQPRTLFAVYPQSRHLSTKVRVFLDYLLARIGPNPARDRKVGSR